MENFFSRYLFFPHNFNQFFIISGGGKFLKISMLKFYSYLVIQFSVCELLVIQLSIVFFGGVFSAHRIGLLERTR